MPQKMEKSGPSRRRTWVTRTQIAVGLLEADDVGMGEHEPFDGFGADVDVRARRIVVNVDGQVGARRNAAEIRGDAVLRRSGGARRDDEEAVCAALRCTFGEGERLGFGLAACRSDDGDAPDRGCDRELDQLGALVEREGLVFAGAAADDEGVRAGVDLEPHQLGKRVEIDRAVPKRRDQRHPRTCGEARLGRYRHAARPPYEQLGNAGFADGEKFRSAVCMRQVSARWHRRVPISTRLGGRLPAHCTALGKAMLAFSSDEVRNSVGSAKLVAKTPRSITDPVALEAELLRITRDRTAVDNEELVSGVVCVAAPVFRDGAVIAAVSVTGPKARIDPHRVAAAVQTAARGISRRLSRPSDRGLVRGN
jgi:hypothetical protein